MCCTSLGYNIEASKTTKTVHTRFVIEKVNDDTIMLKSAATGKYLSIIYRNNPGSHRIEASKTRGSVHTKFKVLSVNGKLALKSIASGRYLSWVTRDGRYNIEAAKLGIDKFSKFDVETGSVAPVREKIISITWGTPKKEKLPKPTVLVSKTLTNSGSETAETDVSLEWSLVKSSETYWEHGWGITAGIKFTQQFGLSAVGFSSALEVSLEVNYNGKKGGNKGTAETLKITQNTHVRIPSGKRVAVNLVAYLIKDAEVPFTATIERWTEDFGATKFKQRGTWKGVLQFNDHVEILEENL